MNYSEDKIKEEIYKCSKCALCQSVCPLYIATKNEMYLPRGRYITLNNFYNNSKPLSSDFIKNIDICLYCNKCKNFCPSSIDSDNIFTFIKSKYGNKSLLPSFSALYFVYLSLVGILPKNIISKRKKFKLLETKGTVLYFEGCYNRYINPSDKNASINLIKSLGYEVEIISDCCGYPFLSDGNTEKFNKNKNKLLNKMYQEYDYIVCSCDTCYYTLSKISEISHKLIKLDEFLYLNNYKFSNQINKDINVFYHKPLVRIKDCYLPDNVLIMNTKSSCALSENFFCFKHKKLTKVLTDNVFYNPDNYEGKTVITTCNISKIGLKKFLKKSYVISYSSFIDGVV